MINQAYNTGFNINTVTVKCLNICCRALIDIIMESENFSTNGVDGYIYCTLIQPHLLYVLPIWGAIFPCDAQKQLKKLQNNANIRAIIGSR